MPSRINIGPEDGPYVAINESSGNLQLEDNSGNVVAEWDETNARWDFANNTLNNVDALNSNSVNTEDADTDRLVENSAPEVKAWTGEGDSPDERLDSAISDSNDEEIIRLENADYDDERTGDDAVDKRLIVRGTLARVGGTRFNGDIDFDNGVSIQNCRIDSTATINRDLTRVSNCLVTGDIIVDDDEFVASNITGQGSITFESGTEDGAIGAKDGRLSITDNGNNEVLSG